MTATPFDRMSRIAALKPRKPGDEKSPQGSGHGDRNAGFAALPGAELRSTSRGCHLGVLSRFENPGACELGPRARSLLAPHAADVVSDSRRWIFLDTETTGLAGGTGTYAFLVGLAWWDGGNFVLEQLFMRDHGEEASLLTALAQRLAERPVLVTFNGKSFDWPLLETRFRMTRTAAVKNPEVHLDLYHPSRQLWRFRLQSVALSELEKHVLAFDRGPDIASHTIPERYFHFLRGGPEMPIVEVFHHNRMDLLGLATLAVHITRMLEYPESCGAEAGEIYGISRMLQRRGEEVLAADGYQRALDFGLPQEAGRVARRELALLARRSGDFARANTLWEEMLRSSPLAMAAYEQLAIHYEHRAKDPDRALALTREAIIRLREANLSGQLGAQQFHRWHDAFRHRLARLEKQR